MNTELAAEGLAREIQILGINPAAYASGNDVMCNGRDLPWLQETGSGSVEAAWGATYRDVVILGPDNDWITAYNLTTYDLSVPANYETLKALFRAAAQAP